MSTILQGQAQLDNIGNVKKNVLTFKIKYSDEYYNEYFYHLCSNFVLTRCKRKIFF